MTNPQSPFDVIRHEDTQGEYWLARELAKALGYTSRDSWRNFERAIEDAKVACISQGYDVTRVFVDIDKNPTAKGGRPGNDRRLTRFACYMVALSADGNKEQVASAKVYFAVMTREQEVLRGLISQVGDNPLTEVARRIEQRMALTEAHKDLMRRARDAGVITSEQCARFMNWGYKGLYSGETEDDIHARKELATRDTISDWMGATETMANVLRATITERRLERQGVATARDANKTHFEAGRTVRGWLASEGILPEDLPRPTKGYKQIVKDEAARIAREEEEERGLWGASSGDAQA